MTTCPVCGCTVGDHGVHDRWHLEQSDRERMVLRGLESAVQLLTLNQIRTEETTDVFRRHVHLVSEHPDTDPDELTVR